jgi:hypothetical protein
MRCINFTCWCIEMESWCALNSFTRFSQPHDSSGGASTLRIGVCRPSVSDTKSPWRCINWASRPVNLAISHSADGSAAPRWERSNSIEVCCSPEQLCTRIIGISELLSANNTNSIFWLWLAIKTIGRWISRCYLCCRIIGETFRATSPRFP